MEAQIDYIAERTFSPKVWTMVLSSLKAVLDEELVEKLGPKYLKGGDYHWRVYYSHKRNLYRDHVNWIVQFFSDKKGKLLDVGCGDGLILSRLNDETDLECWGIDISSLAIELAHRHGVKNCECVDLSKFQVANFDHIFIGDVLEHLPSPELVLRHIGNLLKPGGFLMLSIPIQGGSPRWGDRYVVALPKAIMLMSHEFGAVCPEIHKPWKKYYLLARKPLGAKNEHSFHRTMAMRTFTSRSY